MGERAIAVDTFVTLVPVTCFKCGCAFGMPQYLNKMRLEDHDWFYCPNGHQQHYIGQTVAQQLQQQLDGMTNSRDFYVRRLNEEVKSKRAYRAHLTRAKKHLQRVANGTCPCCKRSFQNLRRHMKTKHPGFRAADES